jgi:hypothetical protein
MPDTDEQIRRAMQEGQFEDLPGQGRPLQLDEDPFEDPDWRLAHHMLRSAGYSLPWIETRREIEADLAAARLALKACLGAPPVRSQRPPPDPSALGPGSS